MVTNNGNLDGNEKKVNLDTYESNLNALKSILKNIDNQMGSLDDLIQDIETANQLVQDCKNKLCNIENSINKIL
ncbi:exodeoxyribonuclease VII small subunit [Aureispira anguillae]|uniref:Exodeoxyribonuclease VII small subunit n=1 Tax=Aureispira anguillae TaxID=2864201 RepID=A0A915YI74_9BACT|nr:exodeoxyribonuclease VII small subunit [Aureispira anguillae]BDS13353.1 exodeoxyribonuclease VII small subunit [Aureispira anguillae]